MLPVTSCAFYQSMKISHLAPINVLNEATEKPHTGALENTDSHVFGFSEA